MITHEELEIVKRNLKTWVNRKTKYSTVVFDLINCAWHDDKRKHNKTKLKSISDLINQFRERFKNYFKIGYRLNSSGIFFHCDGISNEKVPEAVEWLKVYFMNPENLKTQTESY